MLSLENVSIGCMFLPSNFICFLSSLWKPKCCITSTEKSNSVYSRQRGQQHIKQIILPKSSLVNYWV